MRRILKFINYWLVAKKKVSAREFRAKSYEFVESIGNFNEAIKRNLFFDPARIEKLARKDLEGAVDTLEANGIVVFQSLISPKTVTDAKRVTEELESQIASGSAGNLVIRRDGIDSFPIDETKTVANIRSGEDSGMVDVFNVDLAFKEFEAYKHEILEAGIQELISDLTGKTTVFKNLNLYLNRGVKATRGLHVDSYGVNQFKFFTYLTDVESLDFGPYCYGLGTHKMEGLREANLFLNQNLKQKLTNLNLVPSDKVYPILGKAGTSILSNQSGAHGGYPQSDDAKVRFLVMMNFIES